jgi:uncharacterized protein with GYD domain
MAYGGRELLVRQKYVRSPNISVAGVLVMSLFFMFGRYSADAVRQISPQRTGEACRVIENLGGRVREMYALLGEYDLVFLVELPNMTDAMKVAVALGRLTGITFSSAAAIPVDEFDRLISDV